MALTTILEEQTLDFTEYAEAGIWAYAAEIQLAAFEIGETYRVSWDGTEYECTAFDMEGDSMLGNLAIVGMEPDTGEPFILIITASETAGINTLVAETLDDATSHTVAIYLVEEAEALPSATVKLKGYSGAEFTYENVPKVWLAAPDSTEDNPVLVPYTYGEAQDGVEIDPDFSAGDQTVTMADGTLARSMVVKQPDTLIPGNIKAGETVAGINGEYEGETPETEEQTVDADFSGGDMVIEPTEGKYLSKATVTMPETLIPENIAEGVDIAGIIGTLAAVSSDGDFNVFAKIWSAPTATSTVAARYIIATVDELAEAGIVTYPYTEITSEHLYTAVLLVNLVQNDTITTSRLNFAYKQNSRMFYESSSSYRQGWFIYQKSSTAVAYGNLASSESYYWTLGAAGPEHPGLNSTNGLFAYYSSSSIRPIGTYLCAVIQHKTKTVQDVLDM